MNFEDIGRVWREEPSGEVRRRRIEDLSVVRGRAGKFLNKTHRRGRRIFGLTSLLVVPLFLSQAFVAPRPWLFVPGVAMVFTCLALVWVRWRQLRPPPRDSALPVCAAVQAEVARLRFLERFWGQGASWTLAMFAVGEVMAFEGLRPLEADRSVVSFAFYALMIFALSMIIFRNPVYARLKVQPLREELESWIDGLHALESGDAGSTDLEGGTV